MDIGKEISEARKVAQAPRFELGMDWYRSYFVRRFSIYLSYILAKARISPNVITIAMGITALCGSACLVLDNLWWNIVGALLGQLWLILDCVDGEVARLQKRPSVFGIYLDKLTHTIVNPTYILALGLHVYLQESSGLNLAAMILTYSAWHWKRWIGQLARTTLEVESGVKRASSAKMLRNRANRPVFYCFRKIVLQCFSDVVVMLIVSFVIILNHATEFNIAKWVLYMYTISLLLFVAALILRDRRKASQPDLNERQA